MWPCAFHSHHTAKFSLSLGSSYWSIQEDSPPHTHWLARSRNEAWGTEIWYIRQRTAWRLQARVRFWKSVPLAYCSHLTYRSARPTLVEYKMRVLFKWKEIFLVRGLLICNKQKEVSICHTYHQHLLWLPLLGNCASLWTLSTSTVEWWEAWERFTWFEDCWWTLCIRCFSRSSAFTWCLPQADFGAGVGCTFSWSSPPTENTCAALSLSLSPSSGFTCPMHKHLCNRIKTWKIPYILMSLYLNTSTTICAVDDNQSIWFPVSTKGLCCEAKTCICRTGDNLSGSNFTAAPARPTISLHLHWLPADSFRLLQNHTCSSVYSTTGYNSWTMGFVERMTELVAGRRQFMSLSIITKSHWPGPNRMRRAERNSATGETVRRRWESFEWSQDSFIWNARKLSRW